MRGIFTLLAILLFASTTNATTITINDASFENISIANNAFEYQPTSSDWTFNSTSGVIDPFSGFGSPEAPDGEQFGFIQNGSSFEQTISFAVAGDYTISYLEAGRAQGAPGVTGALGYDISLGGNIIHSDSTTTGQVFTPITSSVFSVTAGPHILKFEATVFGTDDTAFFDSISIITINTVPEPSTYALLLIGLIGLGVVRWKRSK